VAALAPDRVRATYLHYGLEITDRTVRVSAPDGRLIGYATSVKNARLLVKGYRKETRNENQSRRDSREERRDGSDKKGV
jgi:hypothetical protein